MQIAFRTHDLGVKGASAAVEKVNNCGIDAVQLVAYKFIDEIAYQPGALNAENAKAVGQAFKDGGVNIGLIGAYFNPVHSNKQKVANCKAVFKDYLKYSSLLGCPIVGSETGSFNDDKWTYHPLNRTEEALTTVVETFTELADYAASVGAYIGMEGAAGHVCWKPSVLKEAIDRVNRPNVKVIFDLYNYLDSENYENYMQILDEGLKLFAGKIVVFHMKDFVIEEGKVKQVPPGQGRFDYPAILKKIKAYDKDAILVLEGTTGENILPCTQFVRRVWEEV